jgi:hypothetical protein
MSALLFAGVCVLWVRSHFVRDYQWAFLPWSGDSAGTRQLKLDLDSGGGQLGISWKVWTGTDRVWLRAGGGIGAQDAYHKTFYEVPHEYARSIPPTFWNRLGFKSYSGPTHSNVCVPYWALALAAAVLPGIWMVRWKRRRRSFAAGCCVVLRAGTICERRLGGVRSVGGICRRRLRKRPFSKRKEESGSSLDAPSPA